jgi:hypothetical protein
VCEQGRAQWGGAATCEPASLAIARSWALNHALGSEFLLPIRLAPGIRVATIARLAWGKCSGM